VVRWIAERGWDAIQEQLFDKGTTDFSAYSEIEPLMVLVNEAKGLYLFNGHLLQVMR
jgi:hypothetical protein